MRLLIVLVMLSFALPVHASTISPREQMKQMVDGVFAVLNSDLTPEAKKQKISGTVQKYLSVESLSQRTLGVYWRQASADQLKHFMSLYVQILEQTYLNRVDDYSGGKVDYLQELIHKDKAILDTEFVSPERKISVKYKMLEMNGVWQIYDVLIEGVSLVRSYRSSYNEILRKEGFDGLFKRMDEKLAQMKKGA
ncbi:MlaC/ttg2D family ABC transporter substrate-binding protein [Geopsychrobacter electrodiphilus]|uniref:MlaC/ttg2D family ABC transporter substrate-binding protein n=1 Tax=Geopsychrobacter electrodiphilus TaxID=225196 RepID=UPI000A03ABEE|nr:ABC transporter substrate-binding protein [Geopsychrobacter electrodiphilus]